MHNPVRLLFLVLLVTLLASACGAQAPEASVPIEANESAAEESVVEENAESIAEDVGGKLIIYSGRSEPLIQPVLDAFLAKYPNVEVLLKAGKNSELANALIEEKGNPQADVFITTELFTIQSLADQGIFQAYRPTVADSLPSDMLGPENYWVGLTRRARVIMYNKDLVSPEDLPDSIFDLTDPKWKGKVAAAGSTNGSMQAQVAVMRQLLGDEVTTEWLNGMIANEVTFFGGHTDVRKAVGAGEFELGLVNHYYYYLQLAEGSNVGVIFPDQGDDQIGLITNTTSVAIINGASNTVAAQAFVDFLLSEEGQKLFAEQNFEYPVFSNVPLYEGLPALSEFKNVDINVSAAAREYDATFDLLETVGLP